MPKITYLVDFLFETLLEHLVSFVENDGLQGGEINVSSLDVVKDTSTSTNKEVDAAAQCPRLVFNVHAAIDRE